MLEQRRYQQDAMVNILQEFGRIVQNRADIATECMDIDVLVCNKIL